MILPGNYNSCENRLVNVFEEISFWPVTITFSMYSQLILSSCLWVTDNIPGSSQHFERLSSSWVFILVWMDLKEKGQRKRLYEERTKKQHQIQFISHYFSHPIVAF